MPPLSGPIRMKGEGKKKAKNRRNAFNVGLVPPHLGNWHKQVLHFQLKVGEDLGKKS